MTSGRLFSWGIEAVQRGGWPAIALFIVHVIAWQGFDVYAHFPQLDIPMHFFGGVVIAYFFHRASIAASMHGIMGPFHRVTHTVLVFALTCTATVFWEFAEFLTDYFFGTHSQLSLDDTLGDMLLGILGGVALIAATFFFAPRLESQSTNA